MKIELQQMILNNEAIVNIIEIFGQILLIRGEIVLLFVKNNVKAKLINQKIYYII